MGWWNKAAIHLYWRLTSTASGHILLIAVFMILGVQRLVRGTRPASTNLVYLLGKHTDHGAFSTCRNIQENSEIVDALIDCGDQFLPACTRVDVGTFRCHLKIKFQSHLKWKQSRANISFLFLNYPHTCIVVPIWINTRTQYIMWFFPFSSKAYCQYTKYVWIEYSFSDSNGA